MRILVEPSDYILRNAGDSAMLYVAITRLSKLWPDASIQVLSDVPDELPTFCSDAIPLDTKGRQIWLENIFLSSRLGNYLPRPVKMGVLALESYLRRNWPSLVEFILKFKLKLLGKNSKDLDYFLEAVSQADLVIANGMGGITDTFPEYTSNLLDILRLAIQRGAVTAMVGQGIGPLEDPSLRMQAKAVLPHIDFISLREERAGRPLLYALGVSPERLLTTGDDAIEMAYQLRTEQLGGGIGVNLRIANHSKLDSNFIEQLRPVLQNAARAYKAPIIPIPISRVPGRVDAEAIKQLMSGYDERSDGGIEIDTPLKVIEQIKRCRVVVTASYHAAVFALSLGIPAIGLAKSAYYVDKFLGLADQFGTGCQAILLNESDWSAKLTAAIERAWDSSEQVKPELLAAAARQIELSHAAYQRVYELVMSHQKQQQLKLISYKAVMAKRESQCS